MRGYDDWKTTNPADNTLGRSNGKPERRVCLECDWRGKGAMEHAEHWAHTGHLIVHGSDPRAKAARVDTSVSFLPERPAGPWDDNGGDR